MYETTGQDLDSVIKKYAPMVQRIAGSIKATVPPNVEIRDLIQAGLEGLMDAHRTYKPATGVPFEAYASLKVRWFIMDELRREDWLPKRLREKRKALDAAIAQLTAVSPDGRVNASQVANALGLDLDDYHVMLGELENAQVVFEEDLRGDITPSGPSFESKGPEEQAEASQIRSLIATAIGKLPERQSLILSLFYEQELTYREIAEILELSIPRIHQLHAEAISRIRALSGLVPAR